MIARLFSRLCAWKRISDDPPTSVATVEVVEAVARANLEAIQVLSRRVARLERTTAIQCSFCRKSEHEVAQLISDRNTTSACICNECLTLSVGLLTEKNHAASR